MKRLYSLLIFCMIVVIYWSATIHNFSAMHGEPEKYTFFAPKTGSKWNPRNWWGKQKKTIRAVNLLTDEQKEAFNQEFRQAFRYAFEQKDVLKELRALGVVIRDIPDQDKNNLFNGRVHPLTYVVIKLAPLLHEQCVLASAPVIGKSKLQEAGKFLGIVGGLSIANYIRQLIDWAPYIESNRANPDWIEANMPQVIAAAMGLYALYYAQGSVWSYLKTVARKKYEAELQKLDLLNQMGMNRTTLDENNKRVILSMLANIGYSSSTSSQKMHYKALHDYLETLQNKTKIANEIDAGIAAFRTQEFIRDIAAVIACRGVFDPVLNKLGLNFFVSAAG